MNKILLLLLFAVMIIPLSVSASVLNDGVLGYYGFNEGSGSVAIDGANRYNGTITGATYSGTNVAGNYSLDFGTTGNNYYVDINTMALRYIKNVSSPFTVSLWVRSTTNSVWQNPLDWGRSGGDNPFFRFFKKGDSNQFMFYIFGNSPNTDIYQQTSNTTIPTDDWMMLSVVSYGNGTINLFQDGVKTGGGTYITDPYTFNADTLLYIGRRTRDTTSNFAGLIDEVLFYNRSLNNTEMTYLYNNQSSGETYPFSTPIPPSNNLQNITFRLLNNDTMSYEVESLVFYNEFNVTILFTTATLELDNSTLWNITFIPGNSSLQNVSYFNQNISGLTFFTGMTEAVPIIPPEPVNMTNVSFTAIDGANDTITGFSININNGSYFGSTAGTSLLLELPDDELSEDTFSIVYSKFGYYTSSYTNINLTGLSHEGTLIVKTYVGDESLDDKSIVWLMFALVGMIGISSIFSRPMLIVFGFSIMFFTYFLSSNIMVAYYWFSPVGYILGAVVILTGMLRLGFGEKF
jgi:hypothetical protein